MENQTGSKIEEIAIKKPFYLLVGMALFVVASQVVIDYFLPL